MLHLQYRAACDDQWHTVGTNHDHRKLRALRNAWTQRSVDPDRFRIVSNPMLRDEANYLDEHAHVPFLQREASALVVFVVVALSVTCIVLGAALLAH